MLRRITLYTFLVIVFILAANPVLIAQESTLYPYVNIEEEELELEVGEAEKIEAVLIDSNDVEIDTTFVWAVVPDTLGTINDISGVFQAENPGEGYVFAAFGSSTDSIHVVVSDSSDDEPGDYPKLKINPNHQKVTMGDTVQFTAVYVSGEESETDTAASWSVEPDSLASIDSNGVFTALSAGEVTVTAVLDSLTVSAEVEIEDSSDGDDGDDDGENFNKIVILPKDTVVTLGSQVQFNAFYSNENGDPGSPVDTALVWELKGMPIGTLSSGGLLTADSVGFAVVKASLDENTYGSSFVIVNSEEEDSTGGNSITITKSSPNPQGYSKMKELSEGEIWTIGGLPHPMNVLNGGKVYFPNGSLEEDIRIHMDLPKFAKDDTGAAFGHDGVVSGVEFQVFVNDTLVEPYYFETPLIVGLVYKRGLLKKLNIEPESLSLYFVQSAGDSLVYDSAGINYTTLDLSSNRIFSSVAHFSTLAVKGKSGVTVGTDKKETVTPTDYTLYQNYPNPFNPTTNISYYLPQQGKVRLTVYNILGKEVKRLVNQIKSSGRHTVAWDGTNNNGEKVSSGLYLYQLSSENFVRTKKMLLLK